MSFRSLRRSCKLDGVVRGVGANTIQWVQTRHFVRHIAHICGATALLKLLFVGWEFDALLFHVFLVFIGHDTILGHI